MLPPSVPPPSGILPLSSSSTVPFTASVPSTTWLPPPLESSNIDTFTGFSLTDEYLAVGAVCLIFVLFIVAFHYYKSRRYESETSDIEAGVGSNSALHTRIQNGIQENELARIEALVFTYGEADKGERSDCDGECVICLSEFKDGDACRTLTKCHHTFHRNCIDEWLKIERHCPLCRNSICVVVVPSGGIPVPPNP